MSRHCLLSSSTLRRHAHRKRDGLEFATILKLDPNAVVAGGGECRFCSGSTPAIPIRSGRPSKKLFLRMNRRSAGAPTAAPGAGAVPGTGSPLLITPGVEGRSWSDSLFLDAFELSRVLVRPEVVGSISAERLVPPGKSPERGSRCRHRGRVQRGAPDSPLPQLRDALVAAGRGPHPDQRS